MIYFTKFVIGFFVIAATLFVLLGICLLMYCALSSEFFEKRLIGVLVLGGILMLAQPAYLIGDEIYREFTKKKDA